MVIHMAGTFAGFDMADRSDLVNLAIALEYLQNGGKDTNSQSFQALSLRCQGSLQMFSQSMERSPLLKKIAKPFLKAPRQGDSCEIEAAGRDLDDYATPCAQAPGSPAYEEAERAWINRQPMTVTSNVLPGHRQRVMATMEDIQQQQKRKFVAEEKRKGGYGPNAVGGIESDCTTSDEDEPLLGEDDTRREQKDNRYSRKAAELGTELNAKRLTKRQQEPTSQQARRGASVSTPALRSDGTKRRSSRPKSQPKKDEMATGRPPKETTSGNGETEPPHSSSHESSAESGRKQGQKTGKEGVHARSQTPLNVTGFLKDAQQLKEQATSHDTRLIHAADDSAGEAATGYYDTTNHDISAPIPRFNKQMKSGYIVTNQTTIDRKPAISGKPDRTKLVFHLETAKPDPANPGLFLPGTPTRYTHKRPFDDFDWNDEKHLKALKVWRSQIIDRKLDRTRKTREHWLVCEHDSFLAIVEEQLRRWRELRWCRLANDFNRQSYMAGVINGMDERYINQGARTSPMLSEPRSAPWRTKAAFYGMAFKWPGFIELINNAEVLYREGHPDAGENDVPKVPDDEDELPDPTAGPPTGPKPKRDQSKKRKSKNISSVMDPTGSEEVKRQRLGNGSNDAQENEGNDDEEEEVEEK